MRFQKIIDLSHTIHNDTPVYPGTSAIEVSSQATLEEDGYRELRLTMTTHTATHIDAPSHMLRTGASLDALPINRFIGPARIIDVRQFCNREIPVEYLQTIWKTNKYEQPEFLLFYSGYDRLWGRPDYFSGFPVLSESAAKWLCTANLKGVGVDCCSVDKIDAEHYFIHKTLLQAGLLIVENLTNLHIIMRMSFIFSAFPLRLMHGDASPVRAVAML